MLTGLPGLAHLLRPPGDQYPESLTEEARQKRVEGRAGLQKCVEFVEEAGVGGELLVDLGNIAGDDLTGDVWQLESQSLVQLWRWLLQYQVQQLGQHLLFGQTAGEL